MIGYIMKKLFLSLVFFCFFSGCTVAPFLVAPIVTGVVYWKNGEARKYYNENTKVLHRSVINSLKELGHPIKRDILTDYNYSILAGDDDQFKISINKKKSNISELCIRVNFLGDKEYSELLFDKIDTYTNTIDYDDFGKPTKKSN